MQRTHTQMQTQVAFHVSRAFNWVLPLQLTSTATPLDQADWLTLCLTGQLADWLAKCLARLVGCSSAPARSLIKLNQLRGRLSTVDSPRCSSRLQHAYALMPLQVVTCWLPHFCGNSSGWPSAEQMHLRCALQINYPMHCNQCCLLLGSRKNLFLTVNYAYNKPKKYSS